jgi:hypothetical protein
MVRPVKKIDDEVVYPGRDTSSSDSAADHPARSLKFHFLRQFDSGCNPFGVRCSSREGGMHWVVWVEARN